MLVLRANGALAGLLGLVASFSLGCSGGNGAAAPDTGAANGGATSSSSDASGGSDTQDNSSGGKSATTKGGTTQKTSAGGNTQKTTTKTSTTKAGTTSTNTTSTGGSGSKNSTTASSKGGSTSTGGSTATTSTPVVNDAACAHVAKGDVTMSVPSGTFSGTLSLELSTSVENAEIRYTTDGSAPTASSSLYSSAIQLSTTARVRAAAFLDGAIAGIGSAALYVARAADLTQEHDLPIIVLDSYNSGVLPSSYTGDRPFVDVAFLGFDVADGTKAVGDTPTVASLAAFHVRGNSSSMFEKKPYRLELRAENGKDRDCPMFGMPAESDWALVGPYADKTLIRNNFVYELGRAMGMQAPRVKLAEVYVNLDGGALTAADYQGVYQVVETIKNQKNRLDLKQLDDTEIAADKISGGYIFKTEWALDPKTPDAVLECPAGTTKPWASMELVDPLPIAAEQRKYLIDYMLSFHNALRSSNPSDESNGYPKYIETATFVDTVIINELTRSLDAYARSQHFYKDRDAKMNAGPLWDFDLIAGVGSTASFGNLSAEGWQYEANASRLGGEDTSTTPTNPGFPGFPGGGGMPGMGPSVDWFPVLIADAAFKTKLAARWKELRGGLLSDAQIATRIDQLTDGLSGAAQRNFAKWPNLETKMIQNMFETPVAPTWEGHVTAMKDWLKARAAWLDTQWK